MENLTNKRKSRSSNVKYTLRHSNIQFDLNSFKGRYIKLRIHGKEKKVNYDEFIRVKALDLQKLQATKDSTIQIMKRKIEFNKNQNEVYNMNILKQIAVEREEELRNAIVSIQKELYQKKHRKKEELNTIYQAILNEIKNIYNKTTEDINQRKSELMDRILLSIANIDYKHSQLLDLKIKEQEDLFRNLHMFTFEMQKIRDNFNEINKRINDLYESNYELKKQILEERLKHKFITSLMKEFKIRTNLLADKINNYRATTYITNNKKEKKPKIKLNIMTSIDFNTNSTRINTVNNNTKINFDTKNDNNIFLKTENNVFNKRNFKKKAIETLKKNIEIWNNKIINISNKLKDDIPYNDIYKAIKIIIDRLKSDKNNYFLYEQKNNAIYNDQVVFLPIQNKFFRKNFLDILMNDKQVFDAIQKGQPYNSDKYFNKNLCGAK